MTGALCISSHALLYWFQSEYLLKVKESGLSDSLLCSTGSHLMRVSLSLVQMCALCFSPSRSGGCSAVSGPLGWACAGIHAVQKTDANICQGIEWEIDSNWGVEGGSIWSRESIRVDGEDTCGLRNWWAGGTGVHAADWANICVPSMCACRDDCTCHQQSWRHAVGSGRWRSGSPILTSVSWTLFRFRRCSKSFLVFLRFCVF